jgi:hypothetical protein
VQSLRAGAARLSWGLCALVALLLASSVLLRALRADAGADPWEQWFDAADLATPGPLADLAVPGLAVFSADAWTDAFGWSLAALGWLGLGLLLSWALRPGAPRAAVTTHARRVGTSPDA